MPRGRRKAGPTVSLFSFLDILAGLIGTLTLIISGMTIFAMTTSEQILKLPDADAAAKVPRYVECVHDGLILHPERTPVALADMENDGGPWKSALQAVAQNADRQYVVFLIRPDGLESFNQAKAMADRREVDTGYEPVYAAGPIRFSAAEGDPKP